MTVERGNRIDTLLAELAARDVRLFVRDGKLAFNAPKGVLTDADKSRIAADRDALIARLSTAIVAPLSGGQTRMWFLNRVDRGSGDYTEHLVFEWPGGVDPVVLDRAIGMVAARHGAIRARFRDGPNGPEMVVPPPGPFRSVVVDIAPDALEAALEAAARRPIDLALDDPARFTVFKLPPDRIVLSVSAHHAAWDGWSNGVFARDLEDAYRTAAAGGTALPPLRRDVTDRRPAPVPEARIARALAALKDMPTLFRPPTDRPRPIPVDTRGDAVTVDIPGEVGRALADAGRAAGATPTMVILTAWGLFLARLAGVSRLLIAVATAGRRDEDDEAMIGYLSETAVIPIDLDGAPDFAALVARVRDATLDATADAPIPLERLVEGLVSTRPRDATPLTQLLFSVQPAKVRAPTLAGIEGRAIPVHNGAARAELSLNLEPTDDGGWNGPLSFATALFDRATVQAWADDFLALLRLVPSLWRAPLDRGRPGELIDPPAPPAARDDGFATETERRLAALWGEFLLSPPTSRDDDFFMLGGHSLALMRLVHKINAVGLGSIDLADAMEATTIAAMAARLTVEEVEPIAPAAAANDDDDVHPASAAQVGIWLSRRDDPASLTWMTAQFVGLGRRVTIEVATRGLTELTARHPATRSVPFERDGTVWERVAPPGTVRPTVHEGLGAAARSTVARRELNRPFAPDDRSLYRFHLFRNCPDLEDDAVFVVADHTVTDGWSQAVLRRDLVALIARAAGDTSGEPLPPPGPTPAAIAARRAVALAGEHGRKLSEFWSEHLDGMDLGEFPAARARPTGAARLGRRVSTEFPPSAIAALDAIARVNGATPTVALLAVAAVLAARMKGDGRDVSIATPFAVRPSADEADVIAGLAEALPLRLSGDLSRTVTDVLDATRASLRAATAHQDYPPHRIIEDRAHAAGGENRPLFDLVAVLEEEAPEAALWSDPVVGAGKYDFALILGRRGDGSARLTVEYDALGHDEDEALAAGGRLAQLLIDAARRPDAAIGDLTLMTGDEERAVVERFSGPDHSLDIPRDRSTLSLWLETVATMGERTALIAPDGKRLTHAELAARADRIAGGLTAARVDGPVVALAVERGVEAIAAILAIWRIGAAYLPIDVKWPPAMLERLMSDAGATAILADATAATRLRPPVGTAIVPVDATGDTLPPYRDVGGAAAAYVMFTSGTTGTPKGVSVPHRGIVRLALDRFVTGATPDDVGTQSAPLAFDATTVEIWPFLIAGGSIRVLSDEETLNPKRMARAISEARATVMWITAGLFNRALDEAPEVFTGLRLVMTGGEAMSPVHARRFLTLHPGVRLLNAYGPTENSSFTTAHRVTPADLDGAIPIGRPIAGTRVFVVDERLRPLPPGCWGELVCAGDGLAAGYAGRPDLTAAAFVELPWGDGARVYRTGDRARLRFDGVIEFGGRRDGQVKIRGHRIETGAIEAILATRPGVREVAVEVVGEGVDRALVAVVAADRASEAEWRAAIAGALPAHMVPALFVVTERIAVNSNGKRDKRALLDLIRAAGDRAPETSTEPARNPAEALTIRLFAELFPNSVIDRNSDFFRLGGHSLRAMRLANRLEEETGRRVSLREIFAARTVAGIAALSSPTSPPTAPVPAVAADAVDLPLSPGQERLWVIQRLFPDTGAYNVPIALDVVGPLDEAALARAFVALEERHHALRLRVFDTGAGPRQRLQPAGSLIPRVVDLSSSSDPEGEARRLSDEEGIRPFDLTRETGARVLSARLAGDRHRLLLTLHHSICDGWSFAPLLRDLGVFYARETGRPTGAPLPPALSFEEVATRRRAFAASPEGRRSLERRTAVLSPPPEPLDLPTDRPRPATSTFRGGSVGRRFSPELTRSLLRLGRSEGATPFAVGSALVTALLSRLSGQTDIVVGTLVSGRDDASLMEVVGFLVNTVVLRRDLSDNPKFRRHLAATREECARAIADQDCALETVLDALRIKRLPGRNPLFDVMIVWQDTQSAPPDFPGVEVRVVEPDLPLAKFDLSFDLGLEDDRLVCRLEYASDLFDRETADLYLERLETLAACAAERPDTPIDELAILSEAERRRVVETLNATARGFDVRRTIIRPLLDRLPIDADRTAVLLDDLAPISYRVFARRAGRVARRLIEAGARPGEAVAVIGPRSPDLLAAIHGIAMAGCAFAPLGASPPEARAAAMLDDLGHPLVLAAPESSATARRVAKRVLDLSDGGEADPIDLGSPDGLAYILFTSGSTGRPKGVAIEHHSVLNRILWMGETFPIGPGDVVLQKTAVTFDVSVWELFWWSWTGAAAALPPVGMERDPRALIDFIERHGVTVLHFVPSMLAEFLSCLEATPDLALKLARVRYVLASGEALDPALVARFDRLIHRPFGAELHNLYGPTEATIDVTWHPCSPWNGGDTVPIGRPIAETSVHILDPRGRVQPIGLPGEIHLGGPQVARGYVNRPDLTALRFIPDPFRPGGRLYRTGDLGRRRHDGAIEYLGRLDDQVKIRGQRIEPGEIERALEAHPAVERAFVVPSRVQGLTELRAFIVPRAAVTSAELKAHLLTRVTEAMVPARFLRVVAAPLTTSGKTDRKALTGEPLDAAPASAPETAVVGAEEAEIRAIWSLVLPPDTEFGIRDGFFDAGGNSLLVIRLHERLEARWPGAFAVPELFALATVADQAARIRERTGRPAAAIPPPVPAPAVGTKAPVPPSPAITDHRSRSGAVAVIGLAVRLAGAETPEEMWRDVVAGADRVRAFPADRAADAATLAAALGRAAPERFREAAYIDDAFALDPRRFRLSPADAALLDPEQRLFLDTAYRALEDAGRGGSALDGARVGVFVGGAPSPVWRDAVMSAFPERLEQVFALNVPSNIATRLSFLHDWRGPAMLVDTACSSSLAATHQALRALRSGECDWALAGGAKVIAIPPDAATRITIDSSTARTRAFSADADGTGMGEGSVVLLLRRLDEAIADGDPIHAVILGSAINQDGASSGPTAPNPAAQAEVIASAARDAGVSLSGLSHIEAHGTGTALGDPIEIEGLTRAFAPETTEVGFATVVSGKGNYGHLDGAAGALGLARAILALAHDTAPPQPLHSAPNPRAGFDRAPVRVPTTPTPLADRGGPRRAGVSSFGLSGINAHVVLERAPTPARVDRAIGWAAILVSAPDEEGLRRLAGDIVAALRADPDTPFADIVRTLDTGRELHEVRLGVWARDRGDLMSRLAVFAAAPEAARDLTTTGVADKRAAERSVVVLHPDEAGARQAAVELAGGARPVWPDGVVAGRLRLPQAPVRRRRLFPPFPDRAVPAPAAPSKAVERGVFARRLGAPEIRDGERRHVVDLHAPDFWPVGEHKLRGTATLVGAAFPAMIAETTPGPIRVTDLRWIRPLRPAYTLSGTVLLQITADGRATLSAADTAERRATYAEAGVEPAPGASVPDLDIGAIVARLGPAAPVPPFDGDAGLVQVGPRWDRARRATGNAEESLVWFSSPDDGETARLHPALLDAMIGAALTEAGHVPSGCAEILLLGDLPADPVVHARRRPVPTGIEADLHVADPLTGRVAMALNGFRLTRVDGGGEVEEDITLAVPRWEPAPPVPRDPGGPVAVFGASAIADRIARRLERDGRLAARGDDVIDGETAARVCATDGVAVIWAPAAGPEVGLRTARALRELVRALRFPTRILGVATGGWAVDGDRPIDPDHAPLHGIFAAVSLEEAMLTARSVDVDDTTDPDRILGELADLTRGVPAIAWRGARRLVRRFRPVAPGTAPARLPSRGVIVVSGGLGGLALALAPALTNGGAVALALLSRRGTPPAGEDPESRLRREAFETLRASGARVETFACDVTDRASLSETLARIRREMGTITGVVHHAASTRGGVLSAEPADLTEFARSLAPKIEGARLLDELTRDDPLDLFLLAGSLTGLTGAIGHAAYTAANVFLDTAAADRKACGRPALAVDWCGLRDVGMAARLLGGRDAGVMIDAAQARDFLIRALATGESQVAVTDPIARAALEPTAARPSAPNAEPTPPAAAPPVDGANRALEAALAVIWADTLGYDTVGPDDDFYGLGGDSIAGMRIVDRVARDLGRTATLADLMTSGTVAAMARRLGERAAARDRVDPDAPGPAPVAERYPVAWEQLAVLRAEEAAEMGTAYNLPVGVRVSGVIDETRLRAAIATLFERQEILRTRFHRGTDDGEPTMEVLASAPPEIETIEVERDEDVDPALEAWVRPFDPWGPAPPVRSVIVRSGGRVRALFLDVHHALADALSMEILLNEIAALYAGTAGAAPKLHLKDYAWWSRRGAGARDDAAARAYRLDLFKGPTPKLDLPSDRPRPARHTWRAELVEFALPDELVGKLRRRAASARTTPFVLMTLAWSLTLGRLARTEDLVIAVPVDARTGTEMAAMPGMLVSLAPLRLTTHAEETVGEAIRRVHAHHGEALQHRSYGLGRLLADLSPETAPDRATLSEVTFSYMNFAGGDGAGERLGLIPHSLRRREGKSDLGIYARDLPQGIEAAIEYYADMFDPDRIRRLGRSFLVLLGALINAPEADPVARLPLIDADERRTLEAWGTGPDPAGPIDRSLFELFLDRVRAAPDAPALDLAGETLSYAALAREAARAGGALLAAGATAGDRIALRVDRGPDWVIWILATAAIGGVHAPIDPDWPDDRIEWIFADTAARIVVVDNDAPAPAGVAVLPVGARGTAVDAGRGDAPAYIMYTSGSTGMPKGVVVPQRAVARLAFAGGAIALGPGDTVLSTGSPAFDAVTWEVWGALLNGARLRPASRDEVMDPDALARAIRSSGATALWLTAGLFHRQIDVHPESLAGLRLVVTGGDVVDPAHIARAMTACPETAFVNGYGPTENTTFTTVHPIATTDVESGPIPIGRPIARTRVVISEPSGAPAPIGVWGEIRAGGDGLALEYLGRPDLTRAAFVDDPDRPGERLYRTGDLGRFRADGVIEFGGRLDDQIKIRGFRVEPGEIERALVEHPTVRAAAALFLKDGLGGGEIVACVVVEGRPPSRSALRALVAARLPAHAVPRRFVLVPDLPISRNGKVDRERLRASLPPEEADEAEAIEIVRDEPERLVARVFSEILGRTIEDRHADFLAIGGHSLSAIRVVNRLAELSGTRVSMRDFLARPTVLSVAALLTGSGESAIPRIPDGPSHPAGHAQVRLHLAQSLDQAGGAAFNIASALPAGADFDPDAFKEALSRLARRHETLRTSFFEEEGTLRQRIAPAVDVPVALDDVSGTTDPGAECERLVRREAARPFDLEIAPLIRARAIRVSPSEWIVLIVLHHIVGDGWSMRILHRELAAFYTDARAGRASAPPPLPIAYRDFTTWAADRDWSASARSRREALAGAPREIVLPTDRPPPERPSHRGDTVEHPLPPETAAGLAALARAAGTTVATVGLALFAGLLNRLTRQNDLVIGMGIAGRDRVEVEGLIGFFVNILPIRVRVDEETEFLDLIGRTRDAVLDAMDHRDYPFDLLIRDVVSERAGTRYPLFNVVFEYQRFDAVDDDATDDVFGSAATSFDAAGSTGRLREALRTPTAKYDLLLFMIEREGRTVFELEFDTDLTDRATAARWLTYLERFARAAAGSANGDPSR